MSAHLACIVGWPVARSLSPAMHNAAFESLGLDWTYVPLAVQLGAIAEGVELLRTLGVDGANVTIPHKVSIIPLLDSIRGDAERFGAVNTIVREGAHLVGDNTDGAGFVQFLRIDAGFEPSGAHAVVIGAGGAARAVALGLAAEGARVTVIARAPGAAARLAEAAEAAGLGGASGASSAGTVEAGAWSAPPSCDLLVNATPERGALPVPECSLAVDLVYLPPDSEFTIAARAAGARTFDGLGMLVHQAALSFEMWTGAHAPADVMRAAAIRALENRDEPGHVPGRPGIA